MKTTIKKHNPKNHDNCPHPDTPEWNNDSIEIIIEDDKEKEK